MRYGTYGDAIFSIVVGIILISSGVYGLMFMDVSAPTVYEYTVSTETVSGEYDESKVVEFSELPEEDRKLLKDAFEGTDTFFGDSTVEVERENKINPTVEWDIISVDGSPVVVSVSGPEKINPVVTPTAILYMAVLMGLAGFTIGLESLVYRKWEEGLTESETMTIDFKDI